MASVKVAVRVRPFNQREIDMGAKLVIQMEGKKTRILSNKDGANNKYKDFTFDHSYWSFRHNDKNYAPQDLVYNDLGTDVIDSAFEGYNACVFAYGQTGSGKTFTMMGSPDSPGLIPRICKTLFNRMKAGQECNGQSYRVDVSYLEIYNERVKDLLSRDDSHNLKVREHPNIGPFVEKLSHHLVTNYPDIQELMERGSRLRTTASTNMNDTSSRSHAIFTVTFLQAGINDAGLPSETTSKIHLVDLAGSERADATKATGIRLKEGGHINKSLVTLGSVIKALAEIPSLQNENYRKSVFIPYRDSVLTWLLKDSLGGNSKTIMIATVSPADCNHGETLSTLRYANRAKNIINKPTINEDPNVRLIRELREEIDSLRSMLITVDRDPRNARLLNELQQKEEKEKVLTAEWTEKWRETQDILREQQALGLRKAGLGVVLDSDRPHLVGIDDDRLSTGVTLYHLNEGETVIGSSSTADINLSGLEEKHCILVLKSGTATLHPTERASCWVNNVLVDHPIRLSQGCIVHLDRTHVFRYNDPAEAAQLRKEGNSVQCTLNSSRLSLLSWSSPNLNISQENLQIQSESSDYYRDIHLNNLSQEEFNNMDAGARLEIIKSQLKRLLEEQKNFEIAKELINKEFEERNKQMEKERQEMDKYHTDEIKKLTEKGNQLTEQIKQLELTRENEIKIVNREETELTSLQSNAQSIRMEVEQRNSVIKNNENSQEFYAALSVLDSQRAELESLEIKIKEKLIAIDERKEIVKKLDDELKNLKTENTYNRIELKQHIISRSQLEIDAMQCRRQSLSLNLRKVVYDKNKTETNEENKSTDSSSPETGSFHTAVSAQPDWSILNTNFVMSDSGVGLLNGSGSGSSHGSPTESPTNGFAQSFLEIIEGDCRPEAKEFCRKTINLLSKKVLAQKENIIKCIEDENCDKHTLNNQIILLQKLQQDHIKLQNWLEQSISKEPIDSESEEAPTTDPDERLSENDSLPTVIRRRHSVADAQIHQNFQSHNHRGQLRSPTNKPVRFSSVHSLDRGSASTYSLGQSQSLVYCSPVMSPIPIELEDKELKVNIPSYLLRGAGSATHYEYEVRISVEGIRWTLLRRYKRFRELHLTMRSRYGQQVSVLPFPPRKFFGKNSETVAEQRRRQLEVYLQKLLAVCSSIPQCPLYACGENPTRVALLEFSSFFRKGVFENSRAGTS